MKKLTIFFSLLIIIYNAGAQTPRINFTAPGVYPEGTAYHAPSNSFFVSSVRTGTIGRVSMSGAYSIFYSDTSLKSSYGMKVDIARNRLWVCTGDANYSLYSTAATYKKLARVIAIDLTSGQKLNDIDLSNLVPGNHFANDLTLDNAGNVYVTDSYSPVVYKINPQMQASVLVQSDFFKSIDIGLNGIVWHSAGYLIVAHHTNGALYKVTLSNLNVRKVESNQFFSGVDGMLFDVLGSLALVQNKGTNKVFRVRSFNNWNSAVVTGGTKLVDRMENPTTLAKKGNQLYVLNAKLNELQDPVEVPSKEFSLQEVKFIPIF